MPFQSAEAYRRFAESVRTTGAVSRTKTIPYGIHLWRAQLGSTTQIQDEGKPEEVEVVPASETLSWADPHEMGKE